MDIHPDDDTFDDAEDDGPDDTTPVEAYRDELVAAAEAFDVPIPEDFPL